MIIYIILIGISLWFIGIRFFAFLRRESGQSVYKLLTTLIIWGGVLFTSVFPDKVHMFSRWMGLGENLNTLIFFGFVMLFFFVFRLLRSVENAERNITDLVRENALTELKIKTYSKKQ